MIIAKWREGYKGLFKGADPTKVANEISELGEEVTAEQIVNAARNEKSELHKCFEWDDTRAAEFYRKEQARDIIHHLVYVEEKIPQERPELKVFHKPQGANGYSEAKFLVKDKDKYERLLAQAYAELRAFKIKYACLQELADILALIN